MAEAKSVTAHELRQYVEYIPETGKFFWKARTERGDAREASWNTKHAGKRAFDSLHSKGYLHGLIKRKAILAHRAAWAIIHGDWPAEQIDHINGDRADNRIENLREFTAAENARNRKRMHGREGKVGVNWDSNLEKWVARMRANGVDYYLGSFKDYRVAVERRLEAERDRGFDKNNGRYAPLTPVKNSRFA